MTMPPLIRILDRGSMIFLITLGILTILVPFLNLAFPPSSALAHADLSGGAVR
jgi:hypothetical protein